MRSLEESLAQYAASHRDRRNIATHFLGIPLVIFSVVLALALVSFPAGGIPVTLAAVASIGASAWYVRLDPAFGAVMAAVLFLMCALASEIAARVPVAAALAGAAALFAAGWALQFRGHRYEGMKPAFLSDASQLLLGPLFLCAEAAFFFGTRTALRRAIEQRVGPTVARRTRTDAAGAR